jgi:hypothetical protein
MFSFSVQPDLQDFCSVIPTSQPFLGAAISGSLAMFAATRRAPPRVSKWPPSDGPRGDQCQRPFARGCSDSQYEPIMAQYDLGKGKTD